MDHFGEHNKHWQSIEDFVQNDYQLRTLYKKRFIHEPLLLDELPSNIPGIYTLCGGRQIGKTTLLKQWMRYLLISKKVDPKTIFFMTGEMIFDHFSLIQMIKTYLEQAPQGQMIYILIDEVTYIKNWDLGIKMLADTGFFENVIVFLTGSDLMWIEEAGKRFPGRRGSASKTDFHLQSLSFYEFMNLVYKSDDLCESLILEAFGRYLKHGGYLTAINDFYDSSTNEIKSSTYNTYSDWIRGDILKRNKRESYLREVLQAIIKTYGSQVTWNSLCEHTSIGHHDTIREYVDLLEAMDVLFVQSALDQNKLTGSPKKAKKIHFKDPFIYHALAQWLGTGKHTLDESHLVESVSVTHYHRCYPYCYYIKAEGEVDIAFVDYNKFYPVEIKWGKQIRPKDLKQIQKYPNGLILGRSTNKSTNIPTEALTKNITTLSLRYKLQEIIESKDIEDSVKIECLKKILKTSFVKISPSNEKTKLNSISYIFDLTEKGAHTKDFEFYGGFLKLLQKDILECIDNPELGCIVVYGHGEMILHVGKVKSVEKEGIIVESLWENLNVVWEHDILSIPLFYGIPLAFYRFKDRQSVHALFERYLDV
jgi:predicted AAA+ superfamily ATPase